MKVALVRPRCTNPGEEEGEPLGIELIGGLLKANSFEAVLFDQRLYLSDKEFFVDLQTASPDILGLSLMSADDVPASLRIIERIREFNEKVLICMGGVYITYNKLAWKKFPFSVKMFPYESEADFLKFCIEVRDGRYDAGEINSKVHPWRPHMDSYSAKGLPVNIQGSRGCIGNCSFCCTPSLPEMYKKWRGREMTSIAGEIEAIMAFSPCRYFQFVDDDALGPDPASRGKAMVECFSALKEDIRFSFQTRGDAILKDGMDEVMLGLRDAGLRRIFVGVENLNYDTLKSWRKPIDPTAVLKKLDQLRKWAIQTDIGYITWHAGVDLSQLAREGKILWEMDFFGFKTATAVLKVLEGSELSKVWDENLPWPGWAFQHKNAELAYEMITAALLPYDQEYFGLREAYLKAAPEHTASSYSCGQDKEKKAIEKRLRQLDKIAYEIFTDVLQTCRHSNTSGC